MIFQPALSAFLRQHFALDWQGVHGAAHWARVRRFGLFLAQGGAVDAEVVTLFALLHDSCRHNDHRDRGHGARAAALVQAMNGHLFLLSPQRLELLCGAIGAHSSGYVADEPTIQACWDADRLDLGRFGVKTDPARLGSERARWLSQFVWPYRQALVKTPASKQSLIRAVEKSC